MNWAKWASLAEIVSSIAIVITLIYLTIGTKQNTDALHATSRQAMLNSDLGYFSNVMEYPELGRRSGLPGETDGDIRLLAHILWFLRVREYAWFQYQNGILDETTWQSYIAPSVLVLASPEGKTVLDQFRGDPEFISYIRALIEND